MQIVIDILEQDYERVVHGSRIPAARMRNAIRNGTPLPKGHGKLIDEKEIDTVVNGVFSIGEYSPETFLNVIHSQCIEAVGADTAESEDKE